MNSPSQSSAPNDGSSPAPIPPQAQGSPPRQPFIPAQFPHQGPQRPFSYPPQAHSQTRLGRALAQSQALGIGESAITPRLTRKVIIVILLNVAGAMLARFVPIFGTVQGVSALLIGMAFAMAGRLHGALYALGYIAGGEVLWRMCSLGLLPWDFGKYSVILISGMAFLRTLKPPPFAPVFYIVLAVPSVLLWLNSRTGIPIRHDFTNYLAFPLALALTGVAFNRLDINKVQLENFSLSLLGPIAGIASICFFTTISEETIVYGTESNLQTSGGFGPNQVSSVVGLGILLAMSFVLRQAVTRVGKVLFLALAFFMAGISALTFSRSGIVIAALSLIIVFPFITAQSGKKIANNLFVFAIVILVFNYLIFPMLNGITGGKLQERFDERGMTGRESMMRGDIQLWVENPLFGVGMGNSRFLRPFRKGFTHSELTRMPAEQGIFGVLGILTLIVASIQNVKRASAANGRLVVVLILAWSALYVTSNSLRIVAPALLIGVTYATFGAGGMASSRRIPFANPQRQGPLPYHPWESQDAFSQHAHALSTDGKSMHSAPQSSLDSGSAASTSEPPPQSPKPPPQNPWIIE